MSYGNGHTKDTYAANPYGEAPHNDGQRGGIHQRRTGGYGGFADGALSVPSESDIERSPLESDFGSRGIDDSGGGSGLLLSGRGNTDDYESSRSRERDVRGQGTGFQNGGPGSKKIQGVLDNIHANWSVMSADDCVPVHVALQLMDYSSLGRGDDYQDFQRTNTHLQKALKAIVNEHHQGFNSSIGTFHKIQASIQASQSRVRTLRSSVQGAKSSLMLVNPEIKGLGASSQKYDDMLAVLAQIAKLQLVPEQLEARISDKHFLPAVDLLQDALRIICRSELENLGALTDLRIYFSNQETSLTDILVEELHDHLYLKSPYCQDRWRAYMGNFANGNASESGTVSLPNTWARPLYTFLDGLDLSLPMDDDASQDPELNSFQYIRMVIESLNKLGHLDIAVDRMEQRLPVELFAIVDRTNQEVDARRAAYTRGPHNSGKDLLGSIPNIDPGRNGALNDLLWTLYSKFEAIAEGHRVVHEVVAGIVKREGLRQAVSLLRGFKEMWKLYQSEIRSLLHDYLASDENQSKRSGRQPASEGSIFHMHRRGRDKRVFKLSEVDEKTADLAADQRDLDAILEASVPGLVSTTQRRSGVTHNNAAAATSDEQVLGHKLLVEPSVFNISSLLPPSLSFLRRLKDLVPHNSHIAMSTLTSFLDEFLVNVFYPQLEETVTELCAQSFAELDAYQEDHQWSRYATKPIFKGTSTFFSLIQSFCKLLDTIPPDLTSTQLIITQMVGYYDRCCEWYKSLVKRPQLQVQDEVRFMKTAATLVDGGEIRQLVESIWTRKTADDEGDPMREEAIRLITKTNETPLDPFDIISDRRSVTSLCLMFSSMQWLALQLNHFRRVIPEKSSSHSESSSNTKYSRHWSLLNSASIQDDENKPVHLPMTQDTVEAFDSILTSIRNLGTTALLTLHVDIRLGIIHMLNRIIHAPYLLAQSAQDPDPSVLSLNADLLSFADTLSTHLPVRAQDFIGNGLALLIDTFLVTNVTSITGGMNEHGCGRMQLNILVLSQNLKSIESSSNDHSIELDRSARFFDLFMEGPDGVIKKAKDMGGEGLEGFSLEELKALMELWYREGTESGAREVQLKARRELGDKLLVLNECLWNR